ncbi:HD domain-containing protein [Candidatus Woesearchaeota archaeon]|nr:HD domain-containing protein [Candidatus Woesearchaeota archaeon]
MVFIRKMSKQEKLIVEEIIRFVEDKHNRSEGHDYSHIMEVCRYSIEIGKRIKDPVDPFILICGALLHDIGRINAPNGLFHGIDGASRTEEFMESLIDDLKTIRKISRIVVRHTPTSMIPPQAPEEKIVFDADALDRLGLMGMVRGIMGKEGTMEHILENRIAKRMADYHKLYYKESRKIGKPLHKETLDIVTKLRKSLAKRAKQIHEIESYKLILEE